LKHSPPLAVLNCIYNDGAGCGGCVPDGTFQVSETNCSQPRNGHNKGDFVVETFVVNSCGNAAGGVLTRIDVVDPSSNNLFCEDTTSGSGRLSFWTFAVVPSARHIRLKPSSFFCSS
jgi:hypothetical protein